MNCGLLCQTVEVALRDGDGWIDCACLSRHWGVHGAAGLLLVRGNEALLQLRAPWVHNGGTWGIPGGARDSHESWTEAALREAVEEIGISPEMLTLRSDFVDDHHTWSYVTVIAEAAESLSPGELNHETMEVRWIDFDAVETLPLHQSFAKSWRAIRPLLHNLP